MDRNKTHYNYIFSNGERHTMTPVEAHKYSNRLKIDILQGPGYVQGRREKSFDGFGWHDGLRRSFKGPRDYRDYLKAHGLVEASLNDKPVEKEFDKPIWTEELIRKSVRDYGLEIGSVMAQALLNGELDWPDGTSESDYDNDIAG